MTYGDKCFKLTAERSEEVNELKTLLKEADTCKLMLAKHAAADTVLILSMAVQARIGCNLYMKYCTTARTRILRLNVKKMCAAVEQGTCCHVGNACIYMVSDTTSAFLGQGKLKALKLVQNATFQYMILVNDAIFLMIYFKCSRHSLATCTQQGHQFVMPSYATNFSRVKKGDVESGQLPLVKTSEPTT